MYSVEDWKRKNVICEISIVNEEEDSNVSYIELFNFTLYSRQWYEMKHSG